ncbi:MAG: type II secretion system protein GspG, partial [Kiritimatiellae bacterium]|nr:type II secretion system protein GspG [Kiritimatiellia bacterium]
LLVILLPVILAMLPIWDGPPVDDSDMEIVYREIPDEQNAFELFRKAEKFMLPIPDVWNDWEEDPQAHAEEIRAWVDANQEALRLLAKGVALGDYQVPEAKPLTGGVPWIKKSREMGLLLWMASRIEKDPSPRVDLHLLQLRHAEFIYNAGSSLIEAVMGTILYNLALASVPETVWSPETETESLRKLMATLVELRLGKERMVRAYQAEYRYGVENLQFSIRPKTAFARPFIRSGTWGYQEENTKRLYLQHHRQAIAYLQGEGPMDQEEDSPSAIIKFTDRIAPMIRNSHNWIGKRFFSNTAVSRERTINQFKATLADLHALRLVTALQLYHREHGHLPDTLDALVPDLLDEVPVDPFDGQPFRYLPAEARIYSIGKNREDNGGSIRVITRRRSTPDRNHTEDRVYGVFEEVEFLQD